MGVARTLEYRPDIDGLRALAVLGVMTWHAGVPGINGGFLGVDVFFVISGFLITQHIQANVTQGRFSFADFYARRARRIFPALFFTLVLTFVAARLILAPEHMQNFAGSALFAISGLSNIYFMGEVGYLDLAPALKPLLHTWSLGVEEQFYLVWPLLVLALSRRAPRWTLAAIIVLALFSLGLAELFQDAQAGFFFTPLRAFEFAIGAALTWLPVEGPHNRLLQETTLVGGLLLILFAFIALDRRTPTPSVATLVPCLGAMLTILGGRARWSGLILRNPLSVGIGKISYSLYLVHYPLFVLTGYVLLGRIGSTTWVALTLTSFAAAALMYRFVEQPFRLHRGRAQTSPARFGLACALLALLLAVPSATIWAGRAWTYPSAREQQIATQLEYSAAMSAALISPAADFAGAGNATKVLILGDSHAENIFGALVLNQAAFPGMRFALGRFDDRCYQYVDQKPKLSRQLLNIERCQGEVTAVRKSSPIAEADVIVIANYWSLLTVPYFDRGLTLLRARSRAKIVIMGQNGVFPYFQATLFRTPDPAEINRLMYAHPDSQTFAINEQLRAASVRNRLPFFDRLHLVCDTGTRSCGTIAAGGELLFADESHWSNAGERFYGALMARNGLAALLRQ